MKCVALLLIMMIGIIGCSTTLEEREIDSTCEKCSEYKNKDCIENSDCGGFPCIDNKCLVKECSSDEDCPNNMC